MTHEEGTSNVTKRILHVVSNVANYADQSEPTGLWLSELTHAWHVFAEKGYDQRLVSPRGGPSPLEPRSLKWPLADASVKAWLNDPDCQKLLATTARPDQIDPADFDAIYFTGGHAVMWDFPDDAGLQRLTRDIYERGGIVSSVCHGYCGLLNTKLSNGALLVAGRRVTGYSWVEEVLAGVAKKVPYNAEEEMVQRGALYEKALLPFTSNVVTDGRLVTGQNPQSAKATAEQVAALV
ncbi:type 1 glutamine amidotransferase domain-containing protein [Burkholderia metallica]|nr:type 1 glutamine amidotransferase domain-containing protein [Burkholderia metallica]